MGINAQHLDQSGAGKSDNPDRTSHPQVADPTHLEKVLSDLRRAAKQKEPEPLCNAYQALRDAAAAMRMKIEECLRLADEALGRPAGDVIIAAYTRRSCFMCEDGTAPCAACGSSGLIEQDRACMHCDGIGLTPCGFCGGTGWAARSTCPPELATAVLRRQRSAARREVKRLGATAAKLTPQKMRKLPQDLRRSLGGWLIRLQARLSDLAQAEVVDDDQRAYLGSVADKIDACLDLLRIRAEAKADAKADADEQ